MCEKKLEDSFRCPHCKKNFSHLNSLEFKVHMKRCRLSKILFGFEPTRNKTFLDPVSLADYNGVIDSCTNLKSILDLSKLGYKIKVQKIGNKNGS